MKIIDTTCPKCGAPLKVDLEKRKAICEYCGYQMLIEREDTVEEIHAKAQAKAYGYHKGKLKAEAEAQAAKKETGHSAKVPVIVICVIMLMAVASWGMQELSKPLINPFDCIEVSFLGRDGEGEAVLDVKSSIEGADVNWIDFDISKEDFLSQGETITIYAASEEYRLSEKKKTYVVEGLDEYLKDLDNIPADTLETIHVRATSVLDINLDSTFVDMKPMKLFLATDGKQTNILYDVFEARFMTHEGEESYYVAAYFEDVVVRDREQMSLDMSYGMYSGNLTQIEGSLWIMAYSSLEEVRADILGSQRSNMKLKELDL